MPDSLVIGLIWMHIETISIAESDGQLDLTEGKLSGSDDQLILQDEPVTPENQATLVEGRDYLQVGNAMEIFRRNNVRFIAVNNGIDSEKPDTLENETDFKKQGQRGEVNFSPIP